MDVFFQRLSKGTAITNSFGGRLKSKFCIPFGAYAAAFTVRQNIFLFNLCFYSFELCNVHCDFEITRLKLNMHVDWIWHAKPIEVNASETVNQEPQMERDFFGETVDMCEGAHEHFTENPEEFKKFVEEAEKPLYRGCHKHTKLSALIKLYNLKARHGMTDNCFVDMLDRSW
ncbi:unnamed protein product [Prunus brigantina]